MSVPSVTITRGAAQTGSVGPSNVGILAIIAPANAGPQNQAFAYDDDGTIAATYGAGPLLEDSSYTLNEVTQPVVLVRPTTSVAAAYSALTFTGTGTSAITAGVAVPSDNYKVTVTFAVTGSPVAVGTAGITYTYSLDGLTTQGPFAVPTGAAPITLTLPAFPDGTLPGVSIVLGAGNIANGDFVTFTTTSAKTQNTDLVAALEALRITATPWEAVLIDQDVVTGTVAQVDAWLAGIERVGKFRMGFLNTRLKNQAAAETETAYATAMTAVVAASTPSIRCSVGSDGGNVTSTRTGLTLPRPAALVTAARAMGIPLGVEPAYVALGPLGNITITDGSGHPVFHDEMLYPNLDQLLLTVLRSVPGQTGVFVNNGRLFSTVGSDYVLIPQGRTMNKGCEIAYAVLTNQLSIGVGKKPTDPVTGKTYILERDALKLEGLVRGALSVPLQGQVAGFSFDLARNDDLSANSGVVLNSTLAIASLAYVKGFNVLAIFGKSFGVTA
jgi:hypothetical protein